MTFARRSMRMRPRSRVIKFGVGAPNDPTELNSISTTAGRAPTILLFYRNFGDQIDTSSLDACSNYGAIPYVTWEPWDYVGPTSPTYTLGNIINGDFDVYITQQANNLKSWGGEVWLRFGHEMNGEGASAETGGDKAAWIAEYFA